MLQWDIHDNKKRIIDNDENARSAFLTNEDKDVFVGLENTDFSKVLKNRFVNIDPVDSFISDEDPPYRVQLSDSEIKALKNGRCLVMRERSQNGSLFIYSEKDNGGGMRRFPVVQEEKNTADYLNSVSLALKGRKNAVPILPPGSCEDTIFFESDQTLFASDEFVALYLEDTPIKQIESFFQQQCEGLVSDELVSCAIKKMEKSLVHLLTRSLPSELDELVLFYGTTLPIRENKGNDILKTFYYAVGSDKQHEEMIMGLWLKKEDWPDFWLRVANDLYSRGFRKSWAMGLELISNHLMQDDGFEKAIEQNFPGTEPVTYAYGLFPD